MLILHFITITTSKAKKHFLCCLALSIPTLSHLLYKPEFFSVGRCKNPTGRKILHRGLMSLYPWLERKADSGGSGIFAQRPGYS